MRYGQSVTWTSFWGDVSMVQVDSCENPEDATRFAFTVAKVQGWTPKRWWQFWRWRDTPNPEKIILNISNIGIYLDEEDL